MNKKYQVLRCGRLYDGVTQEWKSSQSILVEDHLIVEVGSNVSVPEGANVIDLTDCQVTPGMIDAHMHMDYFDWHTVREEVYTHCALRGKSAAPGLYHRTPRWRYHQQRIWRSGCKTRH